MRRPCAHSIPGEPAIWGIISARNNSVFRDNLNMMHLHSRGNAVDEGRDNFVLPLNSRSVVVCNMFTGYAITISSLL